MAPAWMQVLTKPYAFFPDEPCMLEMMKFDAGHEKFSGIYKLMRIQRENRPVWKLLAYMDFDKKLYPVTHRVPTFLAYEPSIGSWAFFQGMGPRFYALCASTPSRSPENVPRDGWIMHERKPEKLPQSLSSMMPGLEAVMQGHSLCFPCEGADVKPLVFSEIRELGNCMSLIDHENLGDELLSATYEDLAALQQPFPPLRKAKFLIPDIPDIPAMPATPLRVRKT